MGQAQLIIPDGKGGGVVLPPTKSEGNGKGKMLFTLGGGEGYWVAEKDGPFIKNRLEAIAKHANYISFACLSMGDQKYVQCHFSGDNVLEYRDGSGDRHYRCIGAPPTVDTIVAVFLAYLAGKPWIHMVGWDRLNLAASAKSV